MVGELLRSGCDRERSSADSVDGNAEPRSKPPLGSPVSRDSSTTLEPIGSHCETMTGGPGLREVLGTPESPVIVADERLGKYGKRARAQLRSVPLFLELGLDRFLYDDLWSREFQLLSHDHRSPDDVDPSDEPFPLVHVVTGKQLLPPDEQDFEKEFISQSDLTWELFRRAAERSGPERPYVVVTDTASPHIPSETPVHGRSVADQFSVPGFEYDQLLHDYVKENVDSELPLTTTKNLYFHRVSERHAEQGAPASDLVELFDYERAPADSPIWDPLYYLVNHELDAVLERYTEHVTEALRSWVEWGDTQKIAKQMVQTLHRCDYDSDRLETYQHDDRRR